MGFFAAVRDAWAALKLLVQVRPAVIIFALQMEAQLLENDHKGGWHDLAPETILRRLREEVDELEAAYHNPSFDIVHEAADIANFAMFAAENYALGAIRRAQEEGKM